MSQAFGRLVNCRRLSSLACDKTPKITVIGTAMARNTKAMIVALLPRIRPELIFD
jgi:hypothetical protein